MNSKAAVILLLLLTIFLFIANVFFGAISIPIRDTWAVLTGQAVENEAYRFIIMESRFPQAVTALTAGAGLSAAGLMLQTLFRNPLAGPSILGITSGAGLGVALIVLLFGGLLSSGINSLGVNLAVMTGAAAGSFFILAILLLTARRVRNNLTLLIVGMMTGYLASSVVTLLSSVSTAAGIQNFVMWGMGSFGGVSLQNLPWFLGVSLAGLGISILFAKPLNLLLLGDNYAANLGVNVKKARFWLLFSSGILASIITACCGPIGFIGLAMPHIARLLLHSDDHRQLLPASMLCGAALALLCNLLSVMPDGMVIPINALTPIAGVPVVLYVILKKR